MLESSLDFAMPDKMFSDLILPIEEMRINPLGFQITQYNISKVRAQKPVIQINSNSNG